VGKPAGMFFSTGTPGGGQETTALTTITQLTHHGMVWVPIGYSNPSLFSMDEVHGGSPYGAGTFAGGDGSRQPTPLELGLAEHQGKYFASIVADLKRGRSKL
jgi:NAD(P)H dehydrogenase (quinone)